MSKDLPYMSTPGTLSKILNKIIEASVPESFNGDFLGTKLGFPGGNQKTFISWAKKCGLLNQDGTPTQLYKNFRNPDLRGYSMAIALKNGYGELYARNEYAHELQSKDVNNLVSDITGKPHDNTTVRAISRTFANALEFADFDYKADDNSKNNIEENSYKDISETKLTKQEFEKESRIKLGLNYTINLVLPKTDDPAIYDAIFLSLKNNLLNE